MIVDKYYNKIKNKNIVILIGILISFSNNVYSYTSSSFTGCQSLFKNTRIKKYYSKITMEDFGFLKNTGIGFDDLWKDNPVISERALEKELNKEGIRFKMNRTEKECEEIEGLWRDIKIGPIILKGPRVLTIWEALGFTATSNNEARQKCKLDAQENASQDPRGVRAKYLGKYGYPRLVGTNGIFYADQLSTDTQKMGGFGMNKSGVIWPVPEIVRKKY
tara:strand:+ start:2095 stop:2751 length:657 start_codon:yes stop_codon:yes gene_type:complete